MRPIHVALMPEGRSRPVLVLTREAIRSRLTNVTVAPVTSRVRDIPTEVPVGPANGLDRASAVNLDNVMTIPVSSLGRFVGVLLDHQEPALTAALMTAYDLID